MKEAVELMMGATEQPLGLLYVLIETDLLPIVSEFA